MGFKGRIKSLAGIEGHTKEYLKPIIDYSCANKMLGGAG